jgi:hypothetical protein
MRRCREARNEFKTLVAKPVGKLHPWTTRERAAANEVPPRPTPQAPDLQQSGVRPLSLALPPAAPIAHPPIDTRSIPTVIAVRWAMPAPPTVKAIHSRTMPASPTIKAIHSRAMPASPTIKAIDPRPTPAPPAAVPPKYLRHVRFIRLSRKEAWASGHRIRRGAKSGGNHCYKGGGYDRSTHAQLLTIRRSPCVIRPLCVRKRQRGKHLLNFSRSSFLKFFSQD